MSARDDVQVLTPMHRGPAGTIALNKSLQTAMNPRGSAIERRGVAYRVGDKVMQTKNDYDHEVYNGDLGVIVGVDTAEEKLTVRFDDRNIDYEDSDIDLLTLAYATSIHKSQGSEYPAVVVPLLTTHFVMLSQNLLYTAVTRAKRLCVLVADPRALRLALSETRREERLTRLAERLRGYVAERRKDG
jgi:exodeoxyribonuclease V alpha subunit